MTRMHDDARRFENELASALAGRRIAFSGSGLEKADVRRAAGYQRTALGVERTARLTLRVEAKTTRKALFSFRVRDWEDLVRAADGAGENPVFAIRFLSDNRSLAIVRSHFLDGAAREQIPVHKSCMLSADTRGQLIVPRQRGDKIIRETLSLLPYQLFLEGIRSYED